MIGASSILLLTSGSCLHEEQDLTSVSVFFVLLEPFVLFIEFKTFNFF